MTRTIRPQNNSYGLYSYGIKRPLAFPQSDRTVSRWNIRDTSTYLFTRQLEIQRVTFHLKLVGTSTIQTYDGDPDDHRYWIFGVNPGAVAASGNDLCEAENDLCATLSGVFLDMAQESNNLDSFMLSANEFLESTDAESLEEWRQQRTVDIFRPSLTITITLADDYSKPELNLMCRATIA